MHEKGKRKLDREHCSDMVENLRKNNTKKAYQLVSLTTMKQGRATTIQDCSGKCLAEEREILNWWTKYYSELYNYKTSGDPSVLNCPQTQRTTTPTFAKIWGLQYNHWKKKSAEIDNILQNWSKQVENQYSLLLRQSATKSDRQENGQPCGPSPLSSHFPRKATCSCARTTSSAIQASKVTLKVIFEQTETASGEDLRWRTGRLLSRKEHQRADLQLKNPLWEKSPTPARPLHDFIDFKEAFDRV